MRGQEKIVEDEISASIRRSAQQLILVITSANRTQVMSGRDEKKRTPKLVGDERRKTTKVHDWRNENNHSARSGRRR